MVLRLFFLLISTLLSVENKCNLIKIISNILTVYNYEITLLTLTQNNGETLLKLIDSNLIKSAHDISLGGIITAISKMCIKGNKGINLKKPKYLISEIEYFFAEDQGRYIVEISKKDQKKVLDILNKNAVHYDELGTIIENMLLLDEKTKVTIDELRSYNTTWLTKYMS